MKPIKIAVIMGMGLTFLGLAQTCYVIQDAEWKKVLEVNSKIREITYADSLLDLEILRLRSGIVDHYDDVTGAYDLLQQSLRELQGQVKGLQTQQEHAVELLEHLGLHVTNKLLLVETIKSQNSVLRNSETYLPALFGEFAKEDSSRGTLLVMHGLLLRTLVLKDHNAAQKLKVQLESLLPSKNYEDNLDDIKTRVVMHGLKTLEIRQTLVPMVLDYFKIPVHVDIAELAQVFTVEQARREFIRETFRTILYGAIFSFALLALYFLIRFLQHNKKVRAEERLFILQALAHEVRTPATGIVLAADALRECFDSLAEDMQDSYLRLCNDVQRLQRVIATTTRYLRAEQDTERLHIQSLDSVSAFLNATLENYESRVQLDAARVEGPFTTDFQWLQVCVTNLVDNALNHGKGTVKVKADWVNDQLQIQVSDEGDSLDLDLDKLVKPFAKSKKSKGLGLGLTIVKRVAVILKGRLTYHGPPTTFILTLSAWDKANARGEMGPA